MRKVYLDVRVRLILRLNEGLDIGEAMNELEYRFASGRDGADVEDTEITDWEVTDAK